MTLRRVLYCMQPMSPGEMTVNGELQRRRRRAAKKTNAAAAAGRLLASEPTFGLGGREGGREGGSCTVFIIDRDRWLLITRGTGDTKTGRWRPGDGETYDEHRAVVAHTCAMCATLIINTRGGVAFLQYALECVYI